MFPTTKIFTNEDETPVSPVEKNTVLNSSKYKSIVSGTLHSDTEESSFSALDVLLENEKQQNKKDAWIEWSSEIQRERKREREIRRKRKFK
jgi:hypothetical protein